MTELPASDVGGLDDGKGIICIMGIVITRSRKQ